MNIIHDTTSIWRYKDIHTMLSLETIRFKGFENYLGGLKGNNPLKANGTIIDVMSCQLTCDPLKLYTQRIYGHSCFILNYKICYLSCSLIYSNTKIKCSCSFFSIFKITAIFSLWLFEESCMWMTFPFNDRSHQTPW